MRPTLRLALLCGFALTLTLALGILAWLLASGVASQAWAGWNERSPRDMVRHALRRLEGHPKLEAIAVPVLRAAQQRLEREPPAGPLPSLGKGQQAQTLPSPIRGIRQTLPVDTPDAIREALLQATPGTQIVVAPGLYPFRLKLRLGHDGLPEAPIVLRAAQPGTVWLAFEQEEGVLVDRPHWAFENLDIRGTCARHDDCEHAFHVVGRASNVIIRNNRLSDFNAHIKVNGWNGDWPDHGLLAFNTLTNTAPRQTANPVTPLDLVGASHWRVEDNWVSHFVKANGNQVSYGLFMKGAGEGGRFERNLVVCTPQGISQPGGRVGISFGGGGTDPGACRQDQCAGFEHRQGRAINNIVAHCNDSGLDINHAREVELSHNTLINTAGVSLRGEGSSAVLNNNLLEGGIHARAGTQVQQNGNQKLDPGNTFEAADSLRLQWQHRPSDATALPSVTHDFTVQRRDVVNAPGALR